MKETFWDDFFGKDIHARDQLQFELTSEFHVDPNTRKNITKQEVYLFIPESFQISSENYSKEQFYLDQTNLIRYKTPQIGLTDLSNIHYNLSPLKRLNDLYQQKSIQSTQNILDELKLFAAMFRSSLRRRVHVLIEEAKQQNRTMPVNKALQNDVLDFCKAVSEIIQHFRHLKSLYLQETLYKDLSHHFQYIDEFASTAIDEVSVHLLRVFRSFECVNPIVNKALTELIIQETEYRKQKNLMPKTKNLLHADESILLRQRLLHGYVLESLLLKHTRFSPQEKHKDILGAIAAGVAMLFYMSLLVWNSSSYVINSFPFVALAVFLYIIKDRIKEGFKLLYSKQAHHWLSDYSTELMNFKGIKVGKLKENFAFITPKEMPKELWDIRNKAFHEELQALQRHETIIQYKREMILYGHGCRFGDRRREVTAIFRLNIHHLIQKASDPIEEKASMDINSEEIILQNLPKVYHLNLIIRDSNWQNGIKTQEEIKAFRVVVNKHGILRVEQVSLGNLKTTIL